MVNTWSEAIRLAAVLLRRLRGYNEKSVKRFFTRDCYHYTAPVSETWHYDRRMEKCLRTWYLRAIITVASVIHPFLRAYGTRVIETVVNELDVSRIDVENDLIRGLGSLIYEKINGYITNNSRGAVTSNDLVIARMLSNGIGDLLSQISRIETLMKNCRDGVVSIGGEELDCTDLWLYAAELHQVLSELQRLAKKYNVSVELDRKPWWLWL
ncbi:hypothetical protein [Vulcanisaeta sp. JCM 14467]|uniref:hypothetical protein n=1 Tax=Vulcanisaeta sp. JCM 14467 TaxID=1295370 RepID=UPI000ADDF6ED|nr:hypothetical protein [Vulcanisaeta sp. JCM 14467]